jgi:PadR family transcriptional regulator, regulatory protein PadR
VNARGNVARSRRRRVRQTERLRGVLDHCILAIVARADCYGYEIIARLYEVEPELAKEGSVYPLLKRLHRCGLVEPYLARTSNGPPRTYYRPTPEGRKRLEGWNHEWVAFRTAVNAILDHEEAR